MAQHSSKIPYSQLIRPLITADRRGHGEDLCACAIMSCTLWTISIYTRLSMGYWRKNGKCILIYHNNQTIFQASHDNSINRILRDDDNDLKVRKQIYSISDESFIITVCIIVTKSPHTFTEWNNSFLQWSTWRYFCIQCLITQGMFIQNSPVFTSVFKWRHKAFTVVTVTAKSF